ASPCPLPKRASNSSIRRTWTNSSASCTKRPRSSDPVNLFSNHSNCFFMVAVFAESPRGKFKKPAFEAVTYGKKVADLLGTSCMAITIGASGAEELGRYGASKVLQLTGPALDHMDSQAYAAAIAEAVQKAGAEVVILSHSSTGKSIAGRLAVRLNAGLVSGVN